MITAPISTSAPCAAEPVSTAHRGTLDAATLRRALAWFRPDLAWVLLLVALIGCSVGLGLLAAWPMAVLADTVLASAPSTAWTHRALLAPFPDNKVAQILGLALLGLLIKVLLEGVWMARMMVNNRIRYRGTTRVRQELYAKLQALGLAHHRHQPQGDSIYRVTTDALGPFGVLDTLVGSAVAVVSLAVMAGVMLSRSVPLTLAALSVTPVLGLVNVYFGPRLKRASLAARQAEAELTTVVQRNLAVVALIQAFSRQAREQARFNGAVDRAVQTGWRFNWQENLYPLAVQATFAAGGAVIFGYGGCLAYQGLTAGPGTEPVTLGTLIVFMDYLVRLWDPLQWVTGFWAKVQTHLAASERVLRVLDLPPTVPEPARPRPLPCRPRVLELRDVGFGYGAGRAVLSGVSARVAPGELVAFVGPSGAGKSTLLNLLVRHHDPSRGAVTLDGRDLREVSLADLRAHVALVPQESLVIPGTVAENIAYGRPGASAAQVRAAVEQAGAAEFLDHLPLGLETVLTEGGGNLSGGQRQRLSLARALLTEAPILVLDEPTSALDPHHAALVLRVLHGLKRRRTVILVTHHLPAVEACDRIYVLDQGRVVEHGAHLALLGGNGLYASLARGGAARAGVAA